MAVRRGSRPSSFLRQTLAVALNGTEFPLDSRWLKGALANWFRAQRLANNPRPTPEATLRHDLHPARDGRRW